MSGAIAVFDYNEWVTRFSEFEDTLSEEQAELLFIEATAFHANDGSGPITDPNRQKVALYYLMAHIAAQSYGAKGSDPSILVGQITNASQGSASVSANPLSAGGTQAWLLTTKYGALYWRLMAPYRTMRYRVAAQRNFDPLPPYRRLGAVIPDDGF